MELKGKIHAISDTVNISATFKKRSFVIEYAENPQYPEFIEFEFIQDKCDIMDGYNLGDEVTVNFNLKGRKWTNPQGEVKYFNTLQAWRINRDSAAPEVPEVPAYNQQQPQTTQTYPQGYQQPVQPQQPIQAAPQNMQAPSPTGTIDDDDIPF